MIFPSHALLESQKVKKELKKPSNQKRTQKKAQPNPNVCASDQMFRFRGKEKINPKKKKLTNLKKEIIQDRTAFHQQGTDTECNSVSVDANDATGTEKKETGTESSLIEPRVEMIPIKQCARE